MKIFFGTDGWRAQLASEINVESVAVVAQAFADYVNAARETGARAGGENPSDGVPPRPDGGRAYACRVALSHEGPAEAFRGTINDGGPAEAFGANIGHEGPAEAFRVAIGYDGRRCSREFARVFARVLEGNGIGVILSDRVIPTPVLSFTVRDRSCFAGVMVTASHNPPSYNGIKFKASYGGPFSLEQTAAVEKLLGREAPVLAADTPEAVNLLPPYIEHLEKLIRFDAIRAADLRILVDSMAGAGATLLQDILAAHGCVAETLFGRPEEDFCGRLPEPVAANLGPLSRRLGEACASPTGRLVPESWPGGLPADPASSGQPGGPSTDPVSSAQPGGPFALGVATDGDADRLGVCLDTGEFLSAQTTILLLADYLKRVRREKGAIVHTSSVTGLLRKHFASPETPVYDVQVGFKYITDIMVREPVCLGAEESGGFGYGMHLPERDGIFSALLFLEMLSVSGFRRLSEYVAARERTLGSVHYARIDSPCHRSDRAEILPRLAADPPERIAGCKVVAMQTFLSSRGIVNGIKFLLEGDCRWLLLRASETEPLLRRYAEGQDGAEVQALLRAGGELCGC